MMLSQRLALFGTLTMAAAIAAAWGFEIIGGYVPCPLCLEQRVPYYVAIPIAVVALLLLPKALGRLGLLVAAVAIFVSAGLGVYHAGAEWAFWEGPATCAGGEEVTDASNLLAAMESANVVSCTDVAGRFLGLSFAGWNVVATGASGLMLLSAAAIPAPR